MGLFSRKKNEEPIELPVIKHTHTWKDMPWYIHTTWNTTQQTAGYEIIEPYICITCGERKNVTLESGNYTGCNEAGRKEIFNTVQKKYEKFLKPHAVVEDMIHNILLVKDISHLRMMEERLGTPHKNVGTSTETLKKTEEKPKVPIIEVKPRYAIERKNHVL